MGVGTVDSGFNLAICGDTWRTGSFSGAQCHGPLKASTSTPTSRTGGSIARNSLAPASSRGLHRAHTHLSLSHAPCRDRRRSTHIQTIHTHQTHTHVGHRDTHTETETHPPGATQTPRAGTNVDPLAGEGGQAGGCALGPSSGSPDCVEAISCLSP